MVLSQYGMDSFVSVWYCHSIDLGDFNKTFDAYFCEWKLQARLVAYHVRAPLWCFYALSSKLERLLLSSALLILV